MKKLFLFLTFSIALTSCKYSDSFEQLSQLQSKKEVVEELYSEDLTEENQKLIKDYFSSIKVLVYEFKNNSKMKKYFHKKFDKFFNSQLCSSTVLDETIYESLMKKCSASGFFICAEEVRDYRDLLNSVKQLLSKKELESITSDEICKNKLVKLGVINE